MNYTLEEIYQTLSEYRKIRETDMDSKLTEEKLEKIKYFLDNYWKNT